MIQFGSVLTNSANRSNMNSAVRPGRDIVARIEQIALLPDESLRHGLRQQSSNRRFFP